MTDVAQLWACLAYLSSENYCSFTRIIYDFSEEKNEKYISSGMGSIYFLANADV